MDAEFLSVLILRNLIVVFAEIPTEPVVELRWDFTDCGRTGRFGPTQEECNEAYQNTNLDGDVIVNNGIQKWTAPTSGLYLITARGASGLKVGRRDAGEGAITTGEFQIQKGETFNVLVGQRSDYDPEAGELRGSGGSGGTFITRENDGFLLMVAGGGSCGAGNIRGQSMKSYADASLDANGKNASVIDNQYGVGGVNGYGGFRGTLDSRQISSAGGGAGYYGNGNRSYVRDGELQGLEFPKPSIRFVSRQFSDRAAGVGGYFIFTLGTTVQENNGGFGGGGSGSADGGAGGGGGYSGGGGGSWGGWGGGGGSINNAESPFKSELHSGRGSVSISLVGFSCCGPVVVYAVACFLAGILVGSLLLLLLCKCRNRFKSRKNK